MKKYLQLTRAHTVPLEAVPAAVGALLATGGSVTLGVVYWTIFGMLYHLAGYGHNSLADWRNGYDKEDPNKQHHPLNRGAISKEHAEDVVNALLIATVTLAMAGVIIYQSVPALAFLVVGVFCGLYYNEAGKSTRFKFVPIAIAHSSVFAVPYLALGGSVNMTGFFMWLVVVLWVTFQISISGEVKDIHQDEDNFLLSMGCEILMGKVITSTKATLTATSIRMLIMLAALPLVIIPPMNTYAFAVVVVFSMVSILETIKMLQISMNYREIALADMARIEMYSLIVFVAAASPFIGGAISAVIVATSALWVVSFNKYQWGTLMAPDV